MRVVKEVVKDTEEAQRLERELNMLKLHLENEIEKGKQKDKQIYELKA